MSWKNAGGIFFSLLFALSHDLMHFLSQLWKGPKARQSVLGGVFWGHFSPIYSGQVVFLRRLSNFHFFRAAIFPSFFTLIHIFSPVFQFSAIFQFFLPSFIIFSIFRPYHHFSSFSPFQHCSNNQSLSPQRNFKKRCRFGNRILRLKLQKSDAQ